MRGDRLWIGNQETTVEEVDPIRGQILIVLPDGDKFFVGPEELTVSKPELQKVRRRHKRQKDPNLMENTQTATDTQDTPPRRDLQAPQSTDPQAQPSTQRQTTLSSDFEFTMYVLSSGSVLKVGSLCFVDSCSSPFIISRIYKSSLGSSVQASGIRCLCDGGKVVSVLCNFQVTVDCSFVRPCNSSEFCLSSVSSEVSKYVFHGQTQVFLSQERNFGNVQYLRELRRHALGAQMRQAVSNGISLNATRPAQPISLGAFEPFHDMMIFNLSEKNSFKVPFSLVGGYNVLDGIMGKGWDVKPLRADVADCHFKFVTVLNVYLDKKHFTLNVSFSYSEAPFAMVPDYRDKCKALLNM